MLTWPHRNFGGLTVSISLNLGGPRVGVSLSPFILSFFLFTQVFYAHFFVIFLAVS